jgi:HNH endonuclease
MPWIRLDDDYIYHPKFTVLSDRAFRLWHEGMAYCRKLLTDGFIPEAATKKFRYSSRKAVTELLKPISETVSALWFDTTGGFQVHDYLQWNPTKEVELANREYDRLRVALNRDPDIRVALRARDGDQCRYCGVAVKWTDRKGPTGATYDHVAPRGPDTLENIVVACRRCNSVKGNKSLEASGLLLRPIPEKNHALYLDSPNRTEFGSGSFEKNCVQKPATSLAPDVIAERAGSLIRRYAELYVKHRHGAKLRLIGNALEFQEACSLVALWDDARLDKLAVIVLETDDEFISKTDRSFKIFSLKATWADDRLRAWEREHGFADQA